jgi:hypothetical protein
MISIDRSSGAGKGVLVALIALGGAAAAWWWWGSSSPAVAPVADVASAASAPGMSGDAMSPGAVDQVPEQDEVGDTTALSQAMSGAPDGQQQLQRVTSFIKFQKEFERWQGLQGEGDPAVRNELGQKLLTQLPLHVSHNSLTLPEGEFMCGMVLTDMETDESVRDQKIQACQASIQAMAPKSDTAQAIKQLDCESDYRSRETTLVAAFQALPSSQRDPSRLQADLDKAKQDIYNDPKCKP